MLNSADIATGRSRSLFEQDMTEQAETIGAAVKNARILAVGAAGSIGSNTVHALSRFEPAALHIIDQNENALAELVRQLRSSPEPLRIKDFQTLPLDYGAEATRQFMAAQGPYDRILNFAAIKHVRSEKDPFSIMQMLDTNIVKQARFRDWISQSSPNADYFSVSTDKAANPVSFMGATKRIMEHVLFDGAREAGLTGKITTARFANVAFSNGSLLQSFENRLARGEPLACPQGISRFFVSLEESGQICALASIIPPTEHVAIPRLDPKEHLVDLKRVADGFLMSNGFTPEYFEDERAACLAVDKLKGENRWPLIMTPANTAGEKPYEEFVGAGETSVEIGLGEMLAVPYAGLQHGGSISELVSQLGRLLNGEISLDKDQIKSLIGEVEPAFLKAHIESDLNLDQRA